MISKSVIVTVAVLFLVVTHPVSARTKCFDFSPAPPFEEWERERGNALMNNYDEYLRCFKTAYHRAVVSCHPEYELENIHVLSPQEVEMSLQEEKEDLGEEDDERRARRALQGGQNGGGGQGGGSCTYCPPEPIGGGSNSYSSRRRLLRPSGADRISAAGVSKRQDMEGCESRRRGGSKSSRKKLFTSYLSEVSEIMTECMRIHRETSNLFHEYLDHGDEVRVRTCLMAEEARKNGRSKDD